MIHGDMTKSNYEYKGIRPQLQTEVTCLLHEFFKDNVFTKDDMFYMVNLACKTTEELKEDFNKEFPEKAQIANLLSKILADAANGNEAALDLMKLVMGDI